MTGADARAATQLHDVCSNQAGHGMRSNSHWPFIQRNVWVASGAGFAHPGTTVGTRFGCFGMKRCCCLCVPGRHTWSFSWEQAIPSRKEPNSPGQTRYRAKQIHSTILWHQTSIFTSSYLINETKTLQIYHITKYSQYTTINVTGSSL